MKVFLKFPFLGSSQAFREALLLFLSRESGILPAMLSAFSSLLFSCWPVSEQKKRPAKRPPAPLTSWEVLWFLGKGSSVLDLLKQNWLNLFSIWNESQEPNMDSLIKAGCTDKSCPNWHLWKLLVLHQLSQRVAFQPANKKKNVFEKQKFFQKGKVTPKVITSGFLCIAARLWVKQALLEIKVIPALSVSILGKQNKGWLNCWNH